MRYYKFKKIINEWNNEEATFCFNDGEKKSGSNQGGSTLFDVLVWGPNPNMEVYRVSAPNKCKEGHETIAVGQYREIKKRLDDLKKK